MKRTLFCSLAIIAVAACALAQTVQYNPDRIIVKFRSGTQLLRDARAAAPRTVGRSADLAESAFVGSSLSSALAKSRISRLRAVKPDADLEPLAGGMERIFIADLQNGQNVESAIQSLSGRADVEYAEPDFIARATGKFVKLEVQDLVPSDPRFNLQWGLQNTGQSVNGITGKSGADINATAAWDITTGNSNLTIAFLDSGILSNAAEFSGRLVAGYDYVNNKTDTTDDNGHGTAVASVAAATGGNGVLMAGVDWKCKIMPIKVYPNSQGTADYSAIILGLNFAADHGAKIINISLAGEDASQPLQDAVDYAYGKGAIIVASMGNKNVGTLTYPAAYNNVIAVGATNSKDQRANPFSIVSADLVGSNYGDNIDFVAPGDFLIAAGYPDPTIAQLFSGTSVSAPIVSGTISLILSIDPSLTFNQIYEILKTGARDQVGLPSEDTPGWDKYYGWGRIDAYRSILAASIQLNLTNGGAGSRSTPGVGASTQAGYAKATVATGSTPYGVAVFRVTQNNVIVSEAGVPASPPTTAARLFIDFRAKSVAGVDINTGIAVVNPNATAAGVTYTLSDTSPRQIAIGHGTVRSGEHIALFINEFKSRNLAPDFNLPSDFSTRTYYGILDITSDQPLSIVALRLTTNQNNDLIITSTPIADMSQTLTNQPLYFPQFADGGGYIATLILLNTSNVEETGTLNLLTDTGSHLFVNPLIPVGETRNWTFNYSIPSGGAYILRTDGSPANWIVGSVQLTPITGSSPVAAGVFSFTQGGVLVTETGVPAVVPTTQARIYIDGSGGHWTGLAIADPTGAGANIALKAYQLDGTTQVGSSKNVPLDPNGHTAAFVWQQIPETSGSFTGVLDISSLSPFVAVTLRALTNSVGHFLLTTFPMADLTESAPAPIIFPQIGDGGLYATQFILLSAGGLSDTFINLYDDNGDPLVLVR